MVAVDWDSGVADGELHRGLPSSGFPVVELKMMYPPTEVTNATSNGTGSSVKEEQK